MAQAAKPRADSNGLCWLTFGSRVNEAWASFRRILDIIIFKQHFLVLLL